MPNVLNEFAGDGVNRNFTFSMTGGYLSRDYVFFFTRPNDDLLNYTPYDDADITWVGDYTVQLSTPIPVGTTFVILRSTPLEPLVDFQNTSRITEKNLDTATQQSIHIASESSDLVGRLEAVVKSAKADADAALLEAEAASEDASQAAQAAISASSAAGQAQSQAQQANAAAQAAMVSSQASEALAIQAGAAAQQATSDAAAASLNSSTAVATANAANSKANQAITLANSAVGTAQAAETKANTARSLADNAVMVANGAASNASSAVSAAASATQVANEAKALVDQAVEGAVLSFNGRSNDVMPQSGDYSKAMVGLGNVDNTSDLDKPISTAVSTALAGKASTTYVNNQLASKADTTTVNNQLAAKADTTYVNNQLSSKADTTYVNNQLALKADSSTVNNQLAQKANTSTVNSQLAQKADSSTVNSQLAQKADKTYVDNAVAGRVTPATLQDSISTSSTADRNRANHTGTQTIATIIGLEGRLQTITDLLSNRMNCRLARSGTNQVKLYRAGGQTIFSNGQRVVMPSATNAVTVLDSSPFMYVRISGTSVLLYGDSNAPVFDSVYGQWVHPTLRETFVGAAVRGQMETKPWLVRSMYNEPGITFSLPHTTAALTWDGTPAVLASDTVALLPGDILHATSSTSIDASTLSGSQNRSFTHDLSCAGHNRSQYGAIPGGGIKLCLPSTVMLSLSWNATAQGQTLQTTLIRSTGNGAVTRPGASTLDKTVVTIHRNF